MVNIVKISDGLGNQIFQYAFARWIQRERGVTVLLDTRFINNEDRIARGETNRYLENNGYREYGLNHFRISLQIADEAILSNWGYTKQRNGWERLILRLAQSGLWPWQYREEGSKRKGYLFGGKDCFISTYFQGYYFNLKYYDDLRTTLRREFRLKKPIALSSGLYQVLRCKNTVGIHIRRGDFIKLRCSICRERYYKRAMVEMEKRVAEPVYLVFSDDIEWVKENMDIHGEKVYISDKGFADYEEFTIMKHCKHHIIANSTFSYWAAYLCGYLDQVVIYPRNWEKADIIPSGWIEV